MQQIGCPQCGAAVTFQSQVSVYAVCRYCQSTLLRSNFDVRLLGSMAALQHDPTVFQIGTVGVYSNEAFELIGRVQRRWSDGFWNEWYMYFGSDRGGWLAEAQGILMVSFLEPSLTVNLETISIGRSQLLKDIRYIVKDIKDVVASFAEGELPAAAEQGHTLKTFDLSGPGRLFATIAAWDGGLEIYTGEYVEYDELNFKRVKEFSGW